MSMNIADLYGGPSRNTATGANAGVSASGPNPGMVTSSGQAGNATSDAFASWMTYLGILVAIRVLIEIRERS